MALNAAVVWEVRTTGSDNNGGGFKAGASGTDRSQQAAAQKSGTDLAIHASDNTKVQPVAAGVAAADIGNLIQITAGSGFTTGFYEITAQDGTYWTLDRAAGTIGSTGGTYAMGGALATPGKALGAVVAGNSVWIKADGTYTPAATVSQSTAGTNTNRISVRGYTTTRGDNGLVTVTPTVGIAGATAWNVSGDYNTLENISLNLVNAGDTGVGAAGSHVYLSNITVDGSRTYSFYCDGAQGFANNCTSVNLNGSAGFFVIAVTFTVYNCKAYNGTGIGFHCWYGRFIRCQAWDMTSDGFRSSTVGGGFWFNCTAWSNGACGFNYNDAAGTGWLTFGCISAENGTYGYKSTTDTLQSVGRHDWNAHYNNTSGAYSGWTAGANDITLTADPFTATGSDNFTLNNTAGGGAALRSVLVPLYLDVGALQHQETAAGGLLVHPGMSGGMRG